MSRDSVSSKQEHRARSMELLELVWKQKPDSNAYKYSPVIRQEILAKAQVHATLALSAPYIITEETGYQ